MRTAMIGWDGDASEADVTLTCDPGESCCDGIRLVGCALRDRPWREFEDYDPDDEPEHALQFLADALTCIGYEIRYGEGIEVIG